MRLRVLLFAELRALCGKGFVDVEVEGQATAGDVVRLVEAALPHLRRILGRCSVAINQRYAEDADLVADGDEIAMIPPVSGG